MLVAPTFNRCWNFEHADIPFIEHTQADGFKQFWFSWFLFQTRGSENKFLVDISEAPYD
jgi:hypothetical protein